MGRYVGLTNNRGKGGGGLGPVKPYTRSTGISTNTENNVTEVILDDVEYTAMQYDSVGLVTGYNENFGGSKKGWVCTYTSQGLINTVVERVPPHYDPRYSITPSVTSVDEGSPAERGGLKEGDRIVVFIERVALPAGTFKFSAKKHNFRHGEMK